MIQFVSQDPQFQKEYLKLIAEEPMRVMPNEIENSSPSSARSSRFSKDQRRMYDCKTLQFSVLHHPTDGA
jgi:hypothetical protein